MGERKLGIGEDARDAVVGERGADAADQDGARGVAVDDETGDEDPAAGADLGASGDVDQAGSLWLVLTSLAA